MMLARRIWLVGSIATGCAAAPSPESPREATPTTIVAAPVPTIPRVVETPSTCPATSAAELLARAPATIAFHDAAAPNDGRAYVLPYGGFVDPRQDAPTMWGIGKSTLSKLTRSVDGLVGDTLDDGEWLVVLPACIPNTAARLRTNDFDDMRAPKLEIRAALRDRATAMLVAEAPKSIRAAFSRRTAKRGGLEPAAFRVLTTNVPGCNHIVAMMADLGRMEHLGAVLCFAADETAGEWLAKPMVGLDPHVIAATDLDADGIEEILLFLNEWKNAAVVRWQSDAFTANTSGKLTRVAMLEHTEVSRWR